MRGRLRNLPLLVGLAASVMMHVMAVLPLFTTALAAETPPYQVDARFDPDDFHPDPEAEEDPVMLGIDRPDQPATMTWIGHREYEEHLAQLAEVDQAAFTRDAAVAGQQTPESTDGRQTQETPAPETPRDVPEPEQEPQPETPDPEAEPEKPEPIEEPELSPADLLAIESLFRALTETPAPIAVREEAENEDSPERRETPEAEDWLEVLRKAIESAEPSVQPTEPTTPGQPAPKTPPGNAPVAGAEPNPGEQSDQESDATSTVEVPLKDLKPGKPIARQGLNVRPHRPRLTNFLRVTAAYGNPLVEIQFARTGKPSHARILESSGDRRIDHAIESSLYRWRASGTELEDLEADGHIDIKIRIILNPRARR